MNYSYLAIARHLKLLSAVRNAISVDSRNGIASSNMIPVILIQ